MLAHMGIPSNPMFPFSLRALICPRPSFMPGTVGIRAGGELHSEVMGLSWMECGCGDGRSSVIATDDGLQVSPKPWSPH